MIVVLRIVLTLLNLIFLLFLEIGESALSNCSSLVELLVPHLQKVNNIYGLTFNGVGNLKVVDVHLSDQFSGFGGALPDKEGTIVYVSNEM